MIKMGGINTKIALQKIQLIISFDKLTNGVIRFLHPPFSPDLAPGDF